MIGIIGAMDIEVDGIKKMLGGCKIKTVSGIDFAAGKLFGKDVVVAKCGIGKVFAALCTEAMITTFSPECIINTGVAGSLSEKLSTMDIAVSSAVVQHDMDTSAIGDPVGLISGINKIEIEAGAPFADKICRVIEKLGMNYEKGVIASGDQFIADKARKDFIKKTFGAVACEMEGAAVGQVCFVNKIPFVVIRAISDNADGTSEIDYPVFAAAAAKNSVSVLTEFVKTYFF